MIHAAPTNRRPAARIRAALLSGLWAMTPEMLATLVSIADRENLSPQAVAAELGRPLDNTRQVALRGNVAVIPIHGPIVRRADMFAEVSGAVSLETLATDFNAALATPGVRAVLLDIDSPGGEAGGVGEFAAMIRAAAATRLVYAYVGGMAASAAYWIAAAAAEVVVAPSALVGNIGIIAGVPDPDKRAGRTIDFVSSQSPHKRPDPRTEGGRARIQATVDAVAAVFIADVARYRGTTAATIEGIGGDVLVGAAAVKGHLANRLGSFEGLVAELQSGAATTRPAGGGAAPARSAAGPDAIERWRAQRADTATGRAFLSSVGIPATGPLTGDHRARIAERMRAAGLATTGA